MSSSTETASTFFALLSLLCVATTVAVVVLALVRRSRPDSAAASWFDDLGPLALWLAWLVATVTTLGSLYYSEIADFTPCELCWYQRICMYPLVLILGVATWRRDRKVWVYVLPLAVVGAAVAIYHTQLQAWPGQATFCTTETPCTTRYVWELGFVSLPFMALSAFAFVITMVLVARATDPARWPDEVIGSVGVIGSDEVGWAGPVDRPDVLDSSAPPSPSRQAGVP